MPTMTREQELELQRNALIKQNDALLAALKFLLKQSAQLSKQVTHEGLENCAAIANARQAIALAEGRP